MSASSQKTRLAVISPFLDKSHGSERIIVEWLAHLPCAFEVHIYSQRVEDIDPSKFTWHRIPKLPGPHLFNFLWWFVANHIWISWDRGFRGLRPDLIFSSGTNCLNADAVCVHIIFPEYISQVKERMRLSRTSVWDWPRLLHQKIYYEVVRLVERRVLMNVETTLIVTSRKTAKEIDRHYKRSDPMPVLYPGIDRSVFNPVICKSLRESARKELKLAPGRFAVILVGNDWRNKGVGVLLETLERLRELPIELLIVSREDSTSWWKLVQEKGLEKCVHLLPPRKDIEFYYAAADVYAGPSLQDSFAMPPAEAMACGLPVIVSAFAGVSEIITDGVDGMILRDPRDAASVAELISRLYEDQPFRINLGKKAAETAQQYTWERNGRKLAAVFEEIVRRKSGFVSPGLTQEL
jgi:glycosyltransferase involved in cell wall biosynthesis